MKINLKNKRKTYWSKIALKQHSYIAVRTSARTPCAVQLPHRTLEQQLIDLTET